MARRAIGGQSVLHGFKLFVKVDSINPIKIASEIKVSKDATLAYHHLLEKNNIKERAARHAIMLPTEFDNIIGITWVPRNADTSRLPTTYIWVQTRTTFDSKPVIMNRTTFRQ